MPKQRTAEAGNFGLKTDDYFADNQGTFSVSDCSKEIDSIQSVTAGLIGPGKVIRLYRCFACNACYGASRMSICLVICRVCHADSQGKGSIARRNQIDRVTNALRAFLRTRLEVR